MTAVWRRWPGLWELDVLAANAAAVAFWTRCIDAQAWSWRPEAGEGGQRLTFQFTIRRSTA
jgi:hypothetical protein